MRGPKVWRRIVTDVGRLYLCRLEDMDPEAHMAMYDNRILGVYP